MIAWLITVFGPIEVLAPPWGAPMTAGPRTVAPAAMSTLSPRMIPEEWGLPGPVLAISVALSWTVDELPISMIPRRPSSVAHGAM